MHFLRRIRDIIALRSILRALALFALVAVTILPANGQARDSRATVSAEYRVKAGFLFNFPQFVDWPSGSFRTPQAPIVIGILGSDPFGAYIDELIRGQKIGGHPITIRRFARVGEISDCHIVYVGRDLDSPIEGVISALAGRAILSVGETESFERAGGIIRFAIEGGKVRLRVNAGAAKASGIAISSKLLRLSTIVNPGKD